MKVPDELVVHLCEMQAELSLNRLEVTLVPSRRSDARISDMIRAVLDRNPAWYRKLCNKYLSSRERNHRKPDTRIRRQDIERILDQMTDGVAKSIYCKDLLNEARKRHDALEEAPF
jgi:hypothetical protein